MAFSRENFVYCLTDGVHALLSSLFAVKHEVMGFFSSRRPEQIEQPLHNDASVVQVIRSRFYGSSKQKGKAREAQNNSSYASSARSVSVKQPDTTSTNDSGSLRKAERYQPTSPSTLRPRPPNLTIPSSEKSRQSTDVITITLAQRLNELATANSQGLLDDDEYRLLRQNLFERLAAGSAVPTEAPVIPVSTPSRTNGRTTPSSSIHTRQSSNFHVQLSRTPSLSSKRSFQSTVSGFLKRASSKKRSSFALDANGSDAGSIYTTPRTPERATFSPSMSQQSGDFSHRSGRPSTMYESDSTTSPRRTPAQKIFRSSDARSIKRAPSVPPSSFPAASLNNEARIAQMSIIDTLEDDERLQNSKEIRQEIELVEAEGRRLLDAFNGLELSTLVKHQRGPAHAPLSAAMVSPVESESPWKSNTLSPTSSLRIGKDPDAMSVISTASGLSRKRSPSVTSRAKQLNASSSAPVFQPIHLSRKTSISSISSRSRSGTAPSHSSPGRHKFGSTSSINLTRSTGHLPLATVSEHEVPYVSSPLRQAEKPTTPEGSQYAGSVRRLGCDEEIVALEVEMADIRKRRAEVTARYDARLEYLRARLKGAEIREKLMKR